ncbi:hypothetical protein K440DRAFT_646220 [Wilcoxina mikolae CBS 423.85]|nr:hypothetical protein K440DRAFT_646220 [Wilcoxina mikolae CBS 423.85]
MIKYKSFSTAVRFIEQKVKEIHEILCTLHAECPRLLAYTWERGFAAHDRPVILMDALGRTVEIPFLFCTEPTKFCDLLEIMFHNLPGHSRVQREQYHLVQMESMILVNSLEWSRQISAGSTILMNIVIRVSVYATKKSRAVACPRCRTEVQKTTIYMQWCDRRRPGLTPLQAATISGNLGVVEQLQAGAEVNTPLDSNANALGFYYALESMDLAILRRLLNAGADFNTIATPMGRSTARLHAMLRRRGLSYAGSYDGIYDDDSDDESDGAIQLCSPFSHTQRGFVFIIIFDLLCGLLTLLWASTISRYSFQVWVDFVFHIDIEC